MPVEVIATADPDPAMFEGLGNIYRDWPGFSLDTLQQQWAEPGCTLFASFFNGKWIASLLACEEGKLARLEYVCVHPATRHRGVGRQLLEKSLQQLSNSGISRLETSLPEDTGAGEFFRKAGFSAGENAGVLVRSVENQTTTP